ncbi:MAG: hypothetical protein RLY31_230 [Bacteroidota bacterium]|jgi:anthranilate synthase component 2
MKILVLDNYDSFTYNLVQYLQELTGERPAVRRNDAITVEEARAFDSILLSPGPGLPRTSGILCTLVRELAPTHRILGVCLGLQAIGEVFGGRLRNLEQVYHGVATTIRVTRPESPLFRGLPRVFQAGRYHSWVVDSAGLPDCLDITCVDETGNIMGLTHRTYDVQGVQFHPESILTKQGRDILANWLSADQPQRETQSTASHRLKSVL